MCVRVQVEVSSAPGRHYVKVANSYYTGAGGHADRIGGLHLWHGDSVAWGMWPNGDIPITGGAMQAGSKVQVRTRHKTHERKGLPLYAPDILEVHASTLDKLTFEQTI